MSSPLADIISKASQQISREKGLFQFSRIMFLYFNCLKPTVAGMLIADERLCGARYSVVGDYEVEGKSSQVVLRQGDDRRSM